jgi:hypothetical protein
MPRGQRIFVVALVFSLLAHWVVAGYSSRWWTSPAHEIPFPIETRLELVASAQVSPAKPAEPVPIRRAVPSPMPMQPVEPIAVPGTAPQAVPDMPVTTTQAPTQFPIDTPVALAPETPIDPPQTPSEEVQPVAAASPETPEPAPRAIRNLPQQIALTYSVQSGEEGFVLGQSIYSGWIRDGRYSLTSVTEATGITAIFVSGKITQRSEGSLTAEGLQPDKFWGEKGKQVQPPVRFDWLNRLLMLPAGAVELPAQTQDLLSFAFHLAMRVQENDAAWELPVTNGKKLRNYQFQVMGWETIGISGGRLEALRLQGSRSGEGSLDVWLAPARHWLPVRIRTLDQKGKVIVLTLQDAPR